MNPNCPDCKRVTVLIEGCHPSAVCFERGGKDCLRAQLAAANERADREAEAHKQQLDLVRESLANAKSEAMGWLRQYRDERDRERAAHAETRRLLDEARDGIEEDESCEGISDEPCGDCKACLRAAHERAERERDEAIRVADEHERGAVMLQALADEIGRERDEAVKRADAMAGAVRELLAAAPEAYGADDSILIGLVDLGEVLDLIAPKCEPRWPATVRELRQRINAALDAARGRG